MLLYLRSTSSSESRVQWMYATQMQINSTKWGLTVYQHAHSVQASVFCVWDGAGHAELAPRRRATGAAGPGVVYRPAT